MNPRGSRGQEKTRLWGRENSKSGLTPGADVYGNALLTFTGLVTILLAIVVAVPLLGVTGNALWLSFFFFVRQDAAFLAFLLIPLLIRPQAGDQHQEWPASLASSRGVLAIALLLSGVCLAGHYVVFENYDLTRDEQLANFDAYIFSHGRIFWPIPQFWRHVAPALDQVYILPIGNHEAWVSEYLPINAAIRALVGTVLPNSLTSPLLAGVGALALWRISLRIWPDAPSARAVAMLLYAGSSQVVLMGMTAFAMTGHLALNLVWLALFLRGKKLSHVGAVLAGFLATGLHRPVFHPLFVLPFMWLLYSQRRWRLFFFYCASYALIGAFWIAWPYWMTAHGVGPVPSPQFGAHGVGLLAYLQTTLIVPGLGSLWLLALNILRFIEWQHLLLMPLLIVGMCAAWRGDALVRALAIGLVLPLPFLFFVQAEQGFGWGYRFLHGEIGNACLLGAYGWQELKSRGTSVKRALAWTSLATFAVAMPARAYTANRFVDHWVSINRAISGSGAAFAIVDDVANVASSILVINRPDLSNRPVRLLGSKLSPSDMAVLCKLGPVMFVDSHELLALNGAIGTSQSRDSRRMAELKEVARKLQCKFAVPA